MKRGFQKVPIRGLQGSILGPFGGFCHQVSVKAIRKGKGGKLSLLAKARVSEGVWTVEEVDCWASIA